MKTNTILSTQRRIGGFTHTPMHVQSDSAASRRTATSSITSRNTSDIMTLASRQQDVQRCRGFTLIEVLLVIAVLAILAAIAIVAINPGKQLGEAQNAQRRNDVRTILDAVGQYTLDNDGELPATITVGTSCYNDGDEICKVDTVCDGVSLDALVSGHTYLAAIPSDPTGATSLSTGYGIMQNSNGRVEVCAWSTYGGESISIMR